MYVQSDRVCRLRLVCLCDLFDFICTVSYEEGGEDDRVNKLLQYADVCRVERSIVGIVLVDWQMFPPFSIHLGATKFLMLRRVYFDIGVQISERTTCHPSLRECERRVRA